MAGETKPASRNDLILDLYASQASVEEISRAVNTHFGNYVGTSEINAVVHRAKQAEDPRALRRPQKKGRGQTTFNNAPFGRAGTRRPPKIPKAAAGKSHTFPKSALLLTDAGPKQCRYPLNADSRQLWVCGAPTIGKLSYCLHHAKLCYEPKS